MGKTETKSCIACAEDIKAEAMLCKHCNTRQDEPTFQKLAPKAPKQASAKTKGSKAKSLGSSSNESTFPEVKPGVVFAVIAAVVVVVFAVTQANSLDFGRTSEPESNSGTSGSSSSINSSLKGEVGYYCEPNLCHLLITNVGSDPVSISGDLCGVLDGAVYIGDNYVSETLNPQITYQVDFSFLGPYEGDKLSKIWLGDCADESSAEIKWTSLSVGTSTSSESGSGQSSSGSAGTSSGSSGGGSTQTTSTPTPTSTDDSQEPAPSATPSREEILDAWFPSVRVVGLSQANARSADQLLVTVIFAFDPYPLSRDGFTYSMVLRATPESPPFSAWSMAFGVGGCTQFPGYTECAPQGSTTSSQVFTVNKVEYEQMSSFVVGFKKTESSPDSFYRNATK